MNDLYIIHYGVGHDKGGHSGRYPWGSGENPYGGKISPGDKAIRVFNKRLDNVYIPSTKLKNECEDFNNTVHAILIWSADRLGRTEQDLVKQYKTNKNMRWYLVKLLTDDGYTAKVRGKTINTKDLTHDLHESFKEQNLSIKREIENFLKKYDAKILFDNSYSQQDYKKAKNIIERSYNKKTGILNGEKFTDTMSDAEWVERYLDNIFGYT